MKTINRSSNQLGISQFPKGLTWLVVLFIASSFWYYYSTQKNRQTATPMEIVMKVRQAAMILSQQGKGALATLRDSNSTFTWKDSYVFVLNCNANLVMANPAFPNREGSDILQYTDQQGKRYGLDLCEAASNKGTWVEYNWPTPNGKAPQLKTSYLISVPGQPYQVGAGMYNSTYTLEELNEMISTSP